MMKGRNSVCTNCFKGCQIWKFTLSNRGGLELKHLLLDTQKLMKIIERVLNKITQPTPFRPAVGFHESSRFIQNYAKILC